MPLNQWEELDIADLGARLGRQVVRLRAARPQLATDPAWASAFQWQKSARRLVRLRQHREVLRHLHELGVQPEQRVRDRQGGDGVRRRVAHRVHQARRTHRCSYGTAPFPAADDHPELYGSGRVGGTIVGIPQGREASRRGVAAGQVPGHRHQLPRAAWRTRSATCRRPPASASSPDLDAAAAVHDVRARLERTPSRPSRRRSLPSGDGYANLLDDFDDKWQAGKIVPNLQPGLAAARPEHREPDLAQGAGAVARARSRRRGAVPAAHAGRAPACAAAAAGCASTAPCCCSSRRGSSASSLFTAGPMLLSLYYSFTHYDLLDARAGSGSTTTGSCSGSARSTASTIRATRTSGTAVRNTLWIIVVSACRCGSCSRC